MKRFRIAINLFAAHKIQTGIGTYLTGLISGFDRIDKEVEPVLILNGEGMDIFKEYLDSFEHYRAPKITDTIKGRVFYEHTVFPSRLKKLGIDLLHSPVFVTPQNYNGPGVLTIHDTTFITHPQYHVPSKRFYFKYCIPRSVKKNQKTIAISKNTRNDLIDLYPEYEDRFEYIPYGVSPIFENFRKSGNGTIYKGNLPRKYFLYVGVLEPRKNLEGTIEAFAKADIPEDINLILAGRKGWYFEEIFNTVKKLGMEKRVKHIGHVDYYELPSLYAGALGFLYPSFYEGFGMPVIEAMASGTPVITSDISSTKEVAGDAALLVDPNSVDSIKNAIERLTKDEKSRKEIIKKGMNRASEFTWEKNALATQELYLEVLNGA